MHRETDGLPMQGGVRWFGPTDLLLLCAIVARVAVTSAVQAGGLSSLASVVIRKREELACPFSIL